MNLTANDNPAEFARAIELILADVARLVAWLCATLGWEADGYGRSVGASQLETLLNGPDIAATLAAVPHHRAPAAPLPPPPRHPPVPGPATPPRPPRRRPARPTPPAPAPAERPVRRPDLSVFGIPPTIIVRCPRGFKNSA